MAGTSPLLDGKKMNNKQDSFVGRKSSLSQATTSANKSPSPQNSTLALQAENNSGFTGVNTEIT